MPQKNIDILTVFLLLCVYNLRDSIIRKRIKEEVWKKNINHYIFAYSSVSLGCVFGLYSLITSGFYDVNWVRLIIRLVMTGLGIYAAHLIALLFVYTLDYLNEKKTASVEDIIQSTSQFIHSKTGVKNPRNINELEAFLLTDETLIEYCKIQELYKELPLNFKQVVAYYYQDNQVDLNILKNIIQDLKNEIDASELFSKEVLSQTFQMCHNIEIDRDKDRYKYE